MDKSADELLRQKVKALMAARRWSQIEFAEQLLRVGYKRSQAWVSRKLTGVQNFRIRDLNLLTAVFDITVPELFFDEYGQWNRRSGSDRRKSDRRHLCQTIYDPHLEVTPEISRLAFPPKEDS